MAGTCPVPPWTVLSKSCCACPSTVPSRKQLKTSELCGSPFGATVRVGDECICQTSRFGGCRHAHPTASRGHLRSGDRTVACFGSVLCSANRQCRGGGELAEPGPGGYGRFRPRSDHTTRKSGWHGRSCIRRGTPSALSAFEIGHGGGNFHFFSRV